MCIYCTDDSTVDKLISNGIYLCARFFSCEKPHILPTIQQCFNCQGYGHEASRCNGKQACAKCGEEHRTKSCSRDKDSYVCINCCQAHASWSTRCPEFQVALEERKRRNQTIEHPQAQEIQKVPFTTANAPNLTTFNTIQPTAATRKQPYTWSGIPSAQPETPSQILDCPTSLVSQMIENTKREWEVKLRQTRMDLEKKVEDKFEETNRILSKLSDKNDECLKPSDTLHMSP